MSLGKKIFHQNPAATGDVDAAQGLVIHVDANDEDSIESGGANTGAVSGTWFDIANHNLNVPLADKADNLQLHLNASDTTSYGGSGSTWTDISGNSRNGTINGGVESTYTTDLRGSFDLVKNSGDYFEIPHHNDISPSSNGVTFESWVTPDNINTTNNIFYIGNDSGYGEFSGGTNNATAFITTMTSSAYVNNVATGNVITAGKLHHIVFTMSNVTNPVVNIYVDGTLSVTNTGSGTVIDTNGNLKIGRYTTGNANDFDGKIHAIRVYNTVLTASEVAQNFRAGNFLSYSSLVTSKDQANPGSLYTSNLAFHLDANGHSGTYWTDSASSINGTISGATYVNDNNSDYFTFDGSNDTVTFPASDTSPVNFSSETHTIEFWVNFNNLADDDVIVGKFGGSNTLKSFQIQVSNSNKITVLERDGSSNNTFETTGTFSNGTWAHFTYVRSASQVILYINGALDATHSASNAINAGSTQDITIGNQAGASVYFDGKLAQVRIYSSTLNSSQVKTNYNATKALYQNPTLQMNLLGSAYTSGTTWSDSANSNDGTISNGSASFDKELGNFLVFDGSPRLTVPMFSALSTATIFSIELWFKSSTATSDGMIMNVYNGAGTTESKFSLSWNGNKFRWVVYGGSNNGYDASQDLFTTNTFSTNTWLHVVATYSYDSEMKIYVNGVLEGAEGDPDHGVSTNSSTQIRWSDRSDGYGVDTQIGETRIYTGVLTQAQVAQNYLAKKNDYPNGFNFSINSATFSTNSSPAYNYFRSDAAAEKLTSGTVDIDISMGMTVSVWLRRHATTGTYQQQFRMTGDGFTSYLFMIAGNGDTRYFYSDGTGNVINTAAGFGDWTTDWINIIHVREANGAGTTNNRGEIYLNGVSGHTQTDLTAATNITSIGFGNNLTSSRVDNVDSGMLKLFQRPFSDAEALAEFNATKATFGIS